MLNNPDAFWGDLRKLGPFPTPKQEANTKDDRPYESLTDDELEQRWDALQTTLEIMPGLSHALQAEIAVLSCALSNERCMRLQPVKSAADRRNDIRLASGLTDDPGWTPKDETPDEPYYDDRAHQMRRD
jgi:hypothetical protein